LESSLKTARLWRAVFRLQSREFAPVGRKLSALKLMLRIDAYLRELGQGAGVEPLREGIAPTPLSCPNQDDYGYIPWPKHLYPVQFET